MMEDVGDKVASCTAETASEKTTSYSYSEITAYLQSGCYPQDASKNEKHGLRKRAKYFVLQGGHLHYIGGKKKMKPRLVVSEEKEQLRLIQNVHAGTSGERQDTFSTK